MPFTDSIKMVDVVITPDDDFEQTGCLSTNLNVDSLCGMTVKIIAEDTIKSNKNINIKKLLYDKNALDKGIKIVVIGGGVLGSQIAYHTAYSGYNVTILVREDDDKT